MANLIFLALLFCYSCTRCYLWGDGGLGIWNLPACLFLCSFPQINNVKSKCLKKYMQKCCLAYRNNTDGNGILSPWDRIKAARRKRITCPKQGQGCACLGRCYTFNFLSKCPKELLHMYQPREFFFFPSYGRCKSTPTTQAPLPSEYVNVLNSTCLLSSHLERYTWLHMGYFQNTSPSKFKGQSVFWEDLNHMNRLALGYVQVYFWEHVSADCWCPLCKEMHEPQPKQSWWLRKPSTHRS